MTELTGMTPQELSDWCKAQGMPAFRGKQIFRWIHQGADFDAMTNLPAAMRAQLKEIAVAQPVSIIDERKSQIDDTVKFLFGLKDGNCVEGVLMHYHHGYTLCISTQVGCRMGCKFCASTLEGCVRSLTAGEMLGEVLATGMVWRRISSFGAWSDTDSVTGRFSSANWYIFGTSPQVERLTLRKPMFTPSSSRSRRRNRQTLS